MRGVTALLARVFDPEQGRMIAGHTPLNYFT
jgi:hypothetical protein